MTDLEIQVNVLKSLLEATDAEVNNFNWMMERISAYGLYPYDVTMHYYPNSRYTKNGMMQVPSEFAAFCNFISNLQVESAIEVGVHRGRSSYFIAALLFRKNKNLKYTMVDICDHLDNFEVYSKIIPCVKVIPATSEDFKGKHFDFVFIDADHSYDASMLDFLNVGQFANKVVCFHDIHGREYDQFNGGIARTWREVSILSKHFTTLTFSHFPNQWMGIGVCVKNEMKQENLPSFNTEVAKIKDFVSTDKKLYLYGSGKLGELYSEFIRDLGGNVTAFVISDDQTKTAASKDGITIIQMNEVSDHPEDCRFVLSLNDIFHKNIESTLRAKGYTDIYYCGGNLFQLMLDSHVN
ncbi:class I SAM-dependent methyltransferase [Paenibacillus sp. CAU 1782]